MVCSQCFFAQSAFCTASLELSWPVGLVAMSPFPKFCAEVLHQQSAAEMSTNDSDRWIEKLNLKKILMCRNVVENMYIHAYTYIFLQQLVLFF